MADVMIEKPGGDVVMIPFRTPEDAEVAFNLLKKSAENDESIVSLSWSAD
jgi:hypothetical protein